MTKEPTLSLEELGEVKTVRVYNQAYVDKQQKRIEALERNCGITQELLDKQIEATYILEKENKELKTVKIPQLERRIASIRGCHSVDAKKLNARIEQVERLKQENAELKARIEKMKCCGNCAKNGHICVAEEMQGELCGKNKDKWELRRVNKWQ